MHRLAAIANKERRLVIGLMSGTSVDGVDAVLVEFGPGPLRMLAHHQVPFPPAVREAVFRCFRPETSSVDEVCHLNFVLGEVYADACLQLCAAAAVPIEQVDIIGSHGQTIWHNPEAHTTGAISTRSTLQIGEPAVIAERTGCVVVADFRTRDIAAGGHGAPLVPYFDWHVLRDDRLSRAVQNIGGIGNVTYLPAGGGPETVLAFDTGPGNMIIDGVMQLLSGGAATCDRDGKLAASGTVDEALLARLLSHPYFQTPPPRTTGREEFGLQFSRRLLQEFGLAAGSLAPAGQRAADLVATVTAFTARSIAESYRRWFPGPVDQVIVSGGGSYNPTLMAMLQQAMGQVAVVQSDQFGIASDAKEAIAFALLAHDAVLGRPTNVPGATGAARPVVLGKIVI